MKELDVRGVAKSFGGQTVLRRIDLTVPAGTFTAVLGFSGSGKTTLLRLIAGFERPDNGEIRLGDRVVDDAGARFVPCEKRRIGYVPQEGALFPHLNVGRNVAFGLTERDKGTRRRRVAELLELVGLSGLGRRYPHQLSGGQQQRVALARALAADPQIVLLDEPFGSLDASLRASVRADVHVVLRHQGITSVLVTHDQDEALSMADQVAVLRDGVIAQADAPASLYGNPVDAHLAGFLGESNLVQATVTSTGVATAFGTLPVAGWASRRPEWATIGARAWVMVRPEQLALEADGPRAALRGVVSSYHYFGHDAVVGVRPDVGGLPDLVVRVTGGAPVGIGTAVGLDVVGPVVAWAGSDEEPNQGPPPEFSRITPP